MEKFNGGNYGILARGGSLRELLLSKSEGGELLVPEIPDPLCLKLCFDMTKGIAYLRLAFCDQRMVHGNLKPANSLLTRDLTCKIGDFGGAKLATCTEYLSSS